MTEGRGKERERGGEGGIWGGEEERGKNSEGEEEGERVLGMRGNELRLCSWGLWVCGGILRWGTKPPV